MNYFLHAQSLGVPIHIDSLPNLRPWDNPDQNIDPENVENPDEQVIDDIIENESGTIDPDEDDSVEEDFDVILPDEIHKTKEAPNPAKDLVAKKKEPKDNNDDDQTDDEEKGSCKTVKGKAY